MSEWLNTKKMLSRNVKKKKPCKKLGYCPYGKLVEEFKLKEITDKFSCKTFGHDCPVYYMAEDITE